MIEMEETLVSVSRWESMRLMVVRKQAAAWIHRGNSSHPHPHVQIRANSVDATLLDAALAWAQRRPHLLNG